MFGIGCRKNSDGADGATALEPNPEPVALSVVSSAVGDLMQPKNDGIRVAGLASNADQNAGFIVIDVPRSERRPHRSDQKLYYKRAGSSSYAMEHVGIEDVAAERLKDLCEPATYWPGQSSSSVSRNSQTLSCRCHWGLALIKAHWQRRGTKLKRFNTLAGIPAATLLSVATDRAGQVKHSLGSRLGPQRPQPGGHAPSRF